jgi:ATP-dependent DNA ligase
VAARCDCSVAVCVAATPSEPQNAVADWETLARWRRRSREHHVEGVMLKERASLYTDYTFAVCDGADLVPFAKACSGPDDAEIRAVDNWVRGHTLERFGPVRRVTPELVFELAFEGLQISSRHKSGIVVRFPRIARW